VLDCRHLLRRHLCLPIGAPALSQDHDERADEADRGQPADPPDQGESDANLSATRIRLAPEESLPSDHRERLNSVVLPHLSDAYTLARWLTGSPADSEDVVQEACLRAYRGIGSFTHGNARALGC
jgi:hypothetical protein